MFRIFAKAPETLKTALEHLNTKNQKYINHNDVVYFLVTKTAEEIKVMVYDICGIDTIEITLLPINKHWMVSVEKCLDFQNTLKLSGFYQTLTGRYLIEGEEKTPKIINLLGPNFTNLIASKSLNVSIPDVDEQYSKAKIHEEKGNLGEIIASLGFPHQIINLSSGYSMLLYFGSHKCKLGNAFGLIMIKINKFNNLVGIYSCINACKCKPEHDSFDFVESSFNFS